MPTQARLAFLAARFRDAVDTDVTVQTAHILAPKIVMESTLNIEADAQAEATRRQALRGVERDRFEFTVPLISETEGIDLGDIIDLSHPRFDLSAGRKVVVLSVRPDAKKKTITLEVWG